MKEELAYFAGLFDAEGCISSSKRKGNKASLSVSFSNCDSRLSSFAAGMLGGDLSFTDRPDKMREYTVKVCSDTAISALKMIKPYLLIKRQQSEIAINFPAIPVRRIQNHDLISLYEIDFMKDTLFQLNKHPMHFYSQSEIKRMLEIESGEIPERWKERPEIAASYIAGLVDGDGTFVIPSKLTSFSPSISISSRHLPAMVEINRYLISIGIMSKIQPCYDKRGYNTTYAVRAFSSNAVELAHLIASRLIAKKDQALLMASLAPLLPGRNGKRVPDIMRNDRYKSASRMKKLNSRFRIVK